MEKTEALARAWIECDPNRCVEMHVTGETADTPIGDRGTNLDGKPRWAWFVPRAEMTEQFLLNNGWSIVPTALANKIQR